MSRRAPHRDRIRYAVDNMLDHGSVAIIAWLFVLSALIVLAAGVLATLAGVAPSGQSRLTFAEAAWASLVRTLDPGTMGADSGWSFRWLMLCVTLGGIFVISTLIGAITSGIDTALAGLRKGRSRVIEADHTVILGWSPQVFTIVAELVEANLSRHRPRIVILAEADKVTMEDELRARVADFHNTRVICRTGSPIEPADVDIASVDTARSIIILSGQDRDSDAEVIKAVLAITRRSPRPNVPYHIVAAIRDLRNRHAARIAGRTEVEWVVVGEVVSRIIAQACRQSGLSTVYGELLDFQGDEIYFAPAGEHAGRAFRDVLNAFESSAVIGLAVGGTQVRLCPPLDQVVSPDNHLILVTEDDDTWRSDVPPSPTIDCDAIHGRPRRAPRPERALILGWNWRGPTIVAELDHYVAPGSEVRVIAACEVSAEERHHCCPDLRNLTISFHVEDTTDRRVLDGLDLESVNHVIVLSYLDSLTPNEADARTLMTLLHLRDIAENMPAEFSIVTEVMDVRNQRLAEGAQVDDFVVSDRIISQVMAQVSENKHLNAVYADLFDPEGCEIYLKPAGEYLELSRPVNFHTVVEAAARRGEIAIGYRRPSAGIETVLGHGMVINPRKSEKVLFGDGDLIVVLAQD